MEKYEFSKISAGINQIRENPYIFQMREGKKCSSVLHTHDFYEIIVTLVGETEQLINGVGKRFSCGEGVLLCPGASHKFLSSTNDGQVFALSVKGDEFELFSKAFDLRECKENAAIFFSADDMYIIGQRINDFRNFSSNGRTHAFRALLADCLVLIGANGEDKGKKDNKNFSRTFREFSKPENLRIGMPALLRLSGYSQAQLTRVLRREYGKTPHEMILSARMDYAYRLITQNGVSTENACRSCGFGSLSHFTKVFTKTFFVSPSELRKRFRTI